MVVVYICHNCGERVELEPKRGIRCAHCGAKVLFKERPKVGKVVGAR